MKFTKHNPLYFIAPILLTLIFACTQTVPPVKIPAVAKPERELRHIVLFKFKDGLSRDTIADIEQAFAGLKNEIPTIKKFEWGNSNSPEKLEQGYTHCFVATFASEKDRDDYLPHPAHQAFVNKFAKPYVDKVCVFDFWAE